MPVRMSTVAEGAGKRAGSRKAPKKKVSVEPSLLLHAGGVTFCVIAWGYLVMAAIDFGASAREGSPQAWLFLLVACIGAACCLFAGLMLGSRLLSALGLIGSHPQVAPDSAHGSYVSSRSAAASATPPPRVPGGRRAAR